MKTKTKEQAGAELLDAIDAYIRAVIAEVQEEKRASRTEQFQKCVEAHKNNPFYIPDDAHGPYAKYLREERGI